MATRATGLRAAQVVLYEQWIATFGYGPEHAGALPGMNGHKRRTLRVLVELGFLIAAPGEPGQFYAVERLYRMTRR